MASIILASAVMSGVEYLFVQLGIYGHNWWRTAYTGIGLLAYFGAATYCFGASLNRCAGRLMPLRCFSFCGP